MIDPVLKWPGGKRWLIKNHQSLFQQEYSRYVEPFLGGGAVFFHLEPKDALLSDSNAELINFYKQLRRDPSRFAKKLRYMERAHTSGYYYKVRESHAKDPFARAARFLYLNRTCFNGIYRENRAGHFNVPIGSKTAVAFPEKFLEEIALCLRRAKLRTADFETIIDTTGTGDLVFVDPPYTVMHNNNNFTKYNAHLFSWADQERLSAAVKRAAKRGALIVVSNADHDDVRGLYKGFLSIESVTRATILAAKSISRRQTTELIVTNFAFTPSQN